MDTGTRRFAHDTNGLNTAAWPLPPDRIVTPTDHFFTRSHAPVPAVDPRTWRLEVDGLVERPARFALAELLDRFHRRAETATLVCAGLRRAEYLAIGPLPGELPWGPEPASTGVWSGVVLRDLLDAVGVAPRARYVELVGVDAVERHGERFGFGGSIDLEKAMSGDVLLANELNGAPLPPAHGFPLRAVVPGWIGARSVKWLGRITLREEPSLNYFQRRAYRVQREVNPADPRDVSAGIELNEVPLNAVIVAPGADATLSAGDHIFYGWAIGEGGSPLACVEVSLDDGRTWRPAAFERDGPRWAWRSWRAPATLARGAHVVVVRATDVRGNAQPADARSTWNVKGYCNNAWHRVRVLCE